MDRIRNEFRAIREPDYPRRPDSRLNVVDFVVLLYNPQIQHLNYSGDEGFFTPILENIHYLLGEGFAGTAAFERRTVEVPLLPESGPDTAKRQLQMREESQYCYIAPLIAKHEILNSIFC